MTTKLTPGLRAGDVLSFVPDYTDEVLALKYLGGVMWRVDCIRTFLDGRPNPPAYVHFFSGTNGEHTVINPNGGKG